MACDGCNYFSFWTIFCHFTTLNSPKNQNFEKNDKRPGGIIVLHMCIKIMIRQYVIPEIWHATDGQTDGKNEI